MADGDFKVFISAVTSEFGNVRDLLASDLRARGATVRVQGDFTQGGDADTLLERLHDYIRDCNAVICVVGHRSGWSPEQAPAKWLAEMLPDNVEKASYTQWEYFFAQHYGRRLYRYLATNDYVPDDGKPNEADALQETFVRHIKHQGGQRAPFQDAAELRIAVLREPWPRPLPSDPRPAPAKPIVLPYPSLGPLFKGREGFMQQLQDSLAGKGKTAITSKALYGLGGIGKTRAAVEYAWAHENDYAALLFVVAETPEALRANLAALAKTMTPQTDTADDNVRLQAALDWFAANSGWFLIIDNVDSPEALAAAEGLLRQLRGGHVVVTSRLADFSANLAPLPLDVLPTDDAAAFLLARTEGRRRASAGDEAKAREIATELDGLALALEQAGAYIAKRRLTFDGYLQQWRSAQHDDVLKWFDATVTGYPKAMAVTWQTSVAQLTEPGRRLLERLAWFTPEKVPEFLLDEPISGAEGEDLHEALADLGAYSLVTRDAEGPFFLVHRLVQDVTRRSLADEQRQRSLVEALAWINVAFPDKPDDVRSWPRAEPLAAHARAVAAEADSAAISDPTARLMNQLGLLLQSKALYSEAESFYQRSLAIREKTLGADDVEVGTALNNLAALYRAQGRYVEAEPLHQRSLIIREQALGPDGLQVAESLNNIATLHYVQGHYADAEPLFQRSLAICEKVLGPDHLQVGATLNNLAELFRAQGRYAEAEPLYQRSLAIREKSLGPDHPAVGTSLNNLAGLYREQGRFAEAEPLSRRDLAICEKALGPNHPDVGVSLNNLAGLLEVQGRAAEAQPLYRRSVKIFAAISRQIGRSHPTLEIAVTNYSGFLGTIGKTKIEIDQEIAHLRSDEG